MKRTRECAICHKSNTGEQVKMVAAHLRALNYTGTYAHLSCLDNHKAKRVEVLRLIKEGKL